MNAKSSEQDRTNFSHSTQLNIMKKSLLNLAAALALAFSLTNVALADGIVGELAFTGSYTVDNPNLVTASAFTSFTGVAVTGATGDYASAVGAAVTMTTFSWDSFPVGGVVPQWALTLTPTTSFDLLNISIDFNTPTALVLSGNGMAHMAGKSDTNGVWNLTANTFGSTFSFSAGSAVPDSGTTAVLLGLSLVSLSLAAFRRKNA